jgi:alkylation response protein AidB-like acyl-CoA dehydrogenase
MDGSIARGTRETDPVARAHGVAQIVREAALRIEQEREIPSDVLAALHEARLFRLLLPRSIDGDEADPMTLAAVTEIVAEADASVAWCLGQGAGCAMSAANLRPADARRIFGPPEAVLAWGAGAAGTARPAPGGYHIDGLWTFASGSRHATWLGAHCIVLDATGKPRLRPDGRKVEMTALFPRSKATVHDVWQVVGLKGTGSDSYEVRGLFVPANEMIDREDPESLYEPAPCFRFPSTFAYAAAFAALMLGIAKGALGDLRTLAMTKTPRGASSSLLESQLFQSQLAELEARRRAARAYHFATLTEVWSDVLAGGAPSPQQRIDLRLAATHTIIQGVQIVTEAYRAAGQSAIFENAPFERRLRDALSASQQVQGRPSHYMTVGRTLLGLPPDATMFI